MTKYPISSGCFCRPQDIPIIRRGCGMQHLHSVGGTILSTVHTPAASLVRVIFVTRDVDASRTDPSAPTNKLWLIADEGQRHGGVQPQRLGSVSLYACHPLSRTRPTCILVHCRGFYRPAFNLSQRCSLSHSSYLLLPVFCP